MKIQQIPTETDHEAVYEGQDKTSGLHAIIAVHRSRPNMAVGGTRMKSYAGPQEALADALRLSRAMTRKFAIADLPLGGGKSVILLGKEQRKSKELLNAFARMVHALKGQYYCAPDVGTTPEDMDFIARTTPYVRGRASVTRDSSEGTALGVFQCMQTAARLRLGTESLAGITVAIQGAGRVGRYLARLLHQAGACLYITDIDGEAVRAVQQETGAAITAPDEILYTSAAILAPCALGQVITRTSLRHIKASVICGAANNQLDDDSLGQALRARNILYIPDYVANAGGVIMGSQMDGGYDEEGAIQRIGQLGPLCAELANLAGQKDIPMNKAADILADRKRAALEKERDLS